LRRGSDRWRGIGLSRRSVSTSGWPPKKRSSDVLNEGRPSALRIGRPPMDAPR
jgi:hypothetical protein